MSKQITSTELATIVSTLLTKPESLGELDEDRKFKAFMSRIAEVVTDCCGGEVNGPAYQGRYSSNWLIDINWNDSVPEGGGVWSGCDTGADFGPEIHEDANRKHDLYKTGDTDATDAIKDRNGEVTLGLCRRCGKAEAELAGPCL